MKNLTSLWITYLNSPCCNIVSCHKMHFFHNLRCLIFPHKFVENIHLVLTMIIGLKSIKESIFLFVHIYLIEHWSSYTIQEHQYWIHWWDIESNINTLLLSILTLRRLYQMDTELLEYIISGVSEREKYSNLQDYNSYLCMLRNFLHITDVIKSKNFRLFKKW